MKYFTAILIFFAFTACGQIKPKHNLPDKKITRDFEQDVNTLLPIGESTVEIMDQVMMSPRRMELMAKAQKALQANPEWFKQQQKIFEETHKATPYDPRVGMTEAEWEEFKKLMATMSDMYVVSSGKAKVVVSKTNDIVSFKSDGKLSYLNSITIDVKNKTVKVDDYSLRFLDTVYVTSADNVFKSSWKGYTFEFSNRDSALTEIPTSQEELGKVSMKLYGFTIGLFGTTNKTFIKFSGSEIKNGQSIMNYEIPIVFQ